MSSDLKSNNSQSINDSDTLKKSISYFSKEGTSDKLKTNHYDTSRPFRLYKSGWEKDYPFYSDWVVYKSIKAKAAIEENGRKLTQRLQSVCPSFNQSMIVRVPVTASFSTEADFFQADPDTEGKSFIHFSTPTTNLIVLDDHLIIADFSNEVSDVASKYKKITLDRLKEVGYSRDKIHFVDASAYHIGMGSIHCGTLTFRDYK